MSRLLFAAARGARIQDMMLGRWSEINVVRISGSKYDYRIHPDDEHLAYGPISTALRGLAIQGESDDANLPYIKVTLLREDDYWSSTEEQRRVFCLILAEALADEGL